MHLNRVILLGLILSVLLAATACVPSKQVADWKDCPGSVNFAPSSTNLPECISSSGAAATDMIQFSIGDTYTEVQANSSLSMGFDATRSFVTDTPVNIQWLDNERSFRFDDVGGTGQAVLSMYFSFDTHLESVEFAWQNRPLSLREVVERARYFQTWLEASGYAPPAAGQALYQPFTVLDQYGAVTSKNFSDWPAAEANLSNDELSIEAVRLYKVGSATIVVSVTAENMRRAAFNFQDRGGIQPLPGVRRTIFDGNGGYEWLLIVRVSHVDPVAN